MALIVSRGGPAQHCPRCRNPLDVEPDTGVDTDAPTPPAPEPPLEPEPQPTPAAAAPAATPASPGDRPRRRVRRSHAPSFARVVAPAPAARKPWSGWLIIAGLAVLLVLQLLLAQRQELAASERWRPLASGVCAVFGCTLAPWHEPGAYTMLARSVQPSGTPGVLRVTASFRNDARWPQPWPALALSLSDVRGQPVAQRTFAARDYRGGDAAGDSELAPGQSASVQFDVVEPASPIVAFNFEFR
ncbi:DUF3426 domain-containing protein [Lysobacter sp. F6437]|uniref:DUF3426 domain-containing protein n=1 Tax=Lysobacter sp. F6437 TaxID=3459296 RepID=UPI00403D561F